MSNPVVRRAFAAFALVLPFCASSAPAPSRGSAEVQPFEVTCKYDASSKDDTGNSIPPASNEQSFDGSLKWDGSSLALSGSMIMNPLDSLVFRNNHGPFIFDHAKAKSLNRREFGAPGGVAVAVGFSAPRPSKAEGKEKTEEFYSVTLQFEKGKLAYMEVTSASFEQGVLIDAGKANSRHCVTTLSPA